MSGPQFPRLIMRERIVSCAINTVLSTVFFVLVFGVNNRAIAIAAPDGFAFDFFPQGGVIAFMATVVPGLVVRSWVAKNGSAISMPVPSVGSVFRLAAAMVVLGLLSAGMLATICLYGPWHSVAWTAALAGKLIYGALLGLGITTLALKRLFARKGQTAITKATA